MYAVIDIGGKQRRVQVGDVVRVERIAGEVGDAVTFDRVFAVGDGDDLRVGAPTIGGALVRATVGEQDRGAKVLTYIFKRRKNSSRKRRGHRQDSTAVKIDAIEV